VKQRIRIVAIASCVLWTGVGAAAESPSIATHVRQTGGFERIIVGTDQPLQLGDLVRGADLVVEGSAVALRSFLDSTEAHIYTDYTFTLHDIVKNRTRPGLLLSGSTIVVRRESGTISIDGIPATAIENDFPAFSEGGRYVLFLKESRDQETWVVLGGGRGAFGAGADISPLATMSIDRSTHAAPRDKFLGEVRALLIFTE
jgi:hypothetical protein